MPDARLHRSALPTLAVKGVSKRFAIGEQTVEALRDVDLTISKGEFVCLIGASGCGKSTLLRIIAGFETASAGCVEMYGAPISAPGPERGMVFQDFALFPWLTVRENVGFGPRQRGLPQAKLDQLSAHFVNMVGLTRFADYYPSQLSGGMKQRVAIARVLANDCEVLLMDEPFGALDALTREQMQQELLELWERTRVTVIFVTHNLEEAVFLGDRVVMLSNKHARVKDDIPIDLPRPRHVLSAELNALRARCTDSLNETRLVNAA